MTGRVVTLLHLCDSLFPVGSFSHSDGLETATAAGHISTARDLSHWITVVRDEALRFVEGPAVSRAWRCAGADDDQFLLAVDDEVNALRPSAAGREASLAMGGRLLKTWQHIRPDDRVARLLSTRPSFTLPVAFGTVCRAADIAKRDAVAGYAYTRLAATLSSAMRLIPLGQNEGHRLLADILDGVPAMVESVVADDAPLQSFVPALDIAAMSHQYVHSRLFRS